MLDTRTKIALARMVQLPVVTGRRLLGLPSELTARRSGISWRLDLGESIDFSIWLLGAFEVRTVAAYSRIVRPGATVFDIGANIGAHTLPLARLVGPTGSVHAFEPVSWAVAKLRANLALNPDLAERVTIHQRLLTDSETGVVPTAIHASWPLGVASDLHPILRGREMPTQGAKTATLDDFVRQAALTRLDFIKLDVDGGECGVIRGGLETLRRLRPTVIVELSPYILEEAGESLEGLVELIRMADCDLHHLGTGRPLPSEPGALRRLIPKGGGINALARPRPRS